MHQEKIMFHVIDHAAVVYTGELSQATQYVIEHYGDGLDAAIRAGIKITYSDSLRRSDELDRAPRPTARRH